MEEKKTEASDTEAGLMSWIKEHRILLTVGLLVTVIVIVALVQNGNSGSTSSPTTNTSAKTEGTEASVKKIWLENSIDRAESEDPDELELDSQKDLQEALKEAKAVFNDENATQADVDTAKSKLDYVLDELKYKSADKDELNKTIEKASSLKKEDYTAETWGDLQDAIESAKTVAEQDVRQSAVDTETANLNGAIDHLEKVLKPEDYESVPYKSIARTPDKYIGKKVKFSGEVLQVIEGDDESVTLRVATSGSYDDVVLVVYKQSIMGNTHILEDDQVTFYGNCLGTYTYKSTMGGNITIPAVDAERIDINS
ncbi:hypothetical protein [uncultured Olegusella sp.]|uniref:hypothetical protein n=1 Tax=uncultured Olegusella sp. TaxID=1979846 RepID=UPI0026374C82|nr:hypothetical protein [uncultured Olegusella sp.]